MTDPTGHAAPNETDQPTYYPTPSLAVGPDVGSVWCASACDAIDVVRSAGRASVPTFDIARDVLHGLGLSAAEAERRIHFALTGELAS